MCVDAAAAAGQNTSDTATTQAAEGPAPAPVPAPTAAPVTAILTPALAADTGGTLKALVVQVFFFLCSYVFSLDKIS